MSSPSPEHVILGTMHSGRLFLDLGRCNWEDFPGLAAEMARRAGGAITAHNDAADIRLWRLEVGAVSLRLVWEDYPHAVSVESDSDEGDRVVMELEKRLQE